MALSGDDSWILGWPAPPVPLRLYCFAYAGGSASVFSDWQADLAGTATIRAVQLPGRGTRHREPPWTDFGAIVSALCDAIGREGCGPFAFFGHSLGALIAFEVARELARSNRPAPFKLFVSGCQSPRVTRSPERAPGPGDDALIAWLRQHNGTPEDILQNRELIALVAPAIRADLGLATGYRYAPGLLLDMPIVVLSGTEDPWVSIAHASRWELETSGPSRTHLFDGDHFFIEKRRHELMVCLHHELRRNDA